MRISDWSSDLCSSDLPRREAVIIVDRLPRRIDPPFQRDEGVRETLAEIMTVKADDDLGLNRTGDTEGEREERGEQQAQASHAALLASDNAACQRPRSVASGGGQACVRTVKYRRSA